MNIEYLISYIIEKIDIKIILFSRTINKIGHHYILACVSEPRYGYFLRNIVAISDYL